MERWLRSAEGSRIAFGDPSRLRVVFQELPENVGALGVAR